MSASISLELEPLMGNESPRNSRPAPDQQKIEIAPAVIAEVGLQMAATSSQSNVEASVSEERPAAPSGGGFRLDEFPADVGALILDKSGNSAAFQASTSGARQKSCKQWLLSYLDEPSMFRFLHWRFARTLSKNPADYTGQLNQLRAEEQTGVSDQTVIANPKNFSLEKLQQQRLRNKVAQLSPEEIVELVRETASSLRYTVEVYYYCDPSMVALNENSEFLDVVPMAQKIPPLGPVEPALHTRKSVQKNLGISLVFLAMCLSLTIFVMFPAGIIFWSIILLIISVTMPLIFLLALFLIRNSRAAESLT